MSDGASSGSESVGTVGEEATKLLQALQGWARDSGSHHAGAAAEAAAAAVDGITSGPPHVDGHTATGGADCRYCPVCQVISAVRGTSPEVRAHLASAATSLVQAAAGLMATPVPDQRPERPEPPGQDEGDGSWD